MYVLIGLYQHDSVVPELDLSASHRRTLTNSDFSVVRN